MKNTMCEVVIDSNQLLCFFITTETTHQVRVLVQQPGDVLHRLVCRHARLSQHAAEPLLAQTGLGASTLLEIKLRAPLLLVVPLGSTACQHDQEYHPNSQAHDCFAHVEGLVEGGKIYLAAAVARRTLLAAEWGLLLAPCCWL